MFILAEIPQVLDVMVRREDRAHAWSSPQQRNPPTQLHVRVVPSPVCIVRIPYLFTAMHTDTLRFRNHIPNHKTKVELWEK